MSALVVLATFMAAGIEWVEALTIVLAVGMFKSWRTAILATLAALAVLAALVISFRLSISAELSPNLARSAVGIFLLLFGLGWLYKAILRSTGLKALHDEAEAFEETKEELMTHGHAFGTAFAGVFLEGLEVVFIVVALGGLNSIEAAAIGAAASLVVVVIAGIALRQPLTRVPENVVKYAVGVMLTSFGTFFAGEGMGIHWWESDLSLLPLIAVYGLASFGFVLLLRRPVNIDWSSWRPVRYARAAILEVWGLFVTDGLLAAVAVTAILFAALSIDRFGLKNLAGPILVVGVLLAVTAALAQAAKRRPAAKVSGDDHSAAAVKPDLAAEVTS
jgi:uncharacterized membrane protein